MGDHLDLIMMNGVWIMGVVCLTAIRLHKQLIDARQQWNLAELRAEHYEKQHQQLLAVNKEQALIIEELRRESPYR